MGIESQLTARDTKKLTDCIWPVSFLASAMLRRELYAMRGFA